MLRALIARKQAEAAARAPRQRVEPEGRLPGTVEETPCGPVHCIARYLEPAHHHGRTPIISARSIASTTLAALALDDGLRDVDPSRLLFLDTETTGLSGGTGTLPFLVGMAWFEDESLRVEQLLLRKPGEERPILARMAERIRSASAIVTYNGKSFDWPLLRTRAIMNRVPVPTPAAHLDLLHCARRLFGARIADARLVRVEAEILGFRRENDVEGFEIPSRFWDFVRGADGSILTPVVEHNANDLVALAALVVALAERWESVLPHHPPEDRLAVAKVAFRCGDHPRALERAQAAAEAGGDARLTTEALVLGAQAARKTEARAMEEQLLLRALEHAVDEAERAHVHLLLCKLYEHRMRDLERALTHWAHAQGAEDEERWARRRARLLRKLAGRSSTPSTG